jgi:LPS-assembly protein
MKKLTSTIPFALLLLVLTSTPSLSAEAGNPLSEQVQIKADSIDYDKKSDTYTASGNVRIDWKGVTLQSNKASLLQGESKASAEGDVRFMKGDDTLSGDKATFDLETEQGEVTNGRLFIKQNNFRISGEKLMKTGKEDYSIRKGYFTTCDAEVPSWKFSASELDVTREEYAVGKNAVFYIKDVPVLYLPYVIYPVKKERQSGFLIPVLGYTRKMGFHLEIPYYLVINPSQDVTFLLDVQTKRGVGTGVDYRYMIPSGGFGEAKSYLIYDTEKEKIRGNFIVHHQNFFSPTIFFRADVDYVLDRTFYYDYGETVGEYNRQYTESSAFLTKHWERFSLTGEVRYTQDLYETSNRYTLQKLPTVNFTGVKQQLGQTPFYASLDSTFVNFYRDLGLKGQRLDLHPKITFYTSPGGIVEGSAWIGYRERIYNTNHKLESRVNEIGIPDMGVSLSTTLSRVYDVDWGNLKRLKHVVIPEISYVYSPLRDQNDLPFFDYYDRQVEQNTIGYSVTNYLTGKYISGDDPAVYRDLAYLRLSQGYSFSGTRRDVLSSVEDSKPFSNMRIQAKANPLENVSFSFDSRFNTNRMNFPYVAVGTEVSDKQGNAAGIDYVFARGSGGVRYLDGKIDLAYLKPFAFHYATRYSFDKGGFLESFYAVDYKHQCWGVTLSYRDRPGNRSFYVSFTLSGLGAFFKFKAF